MAIELDAIIDENGELRARVPKGIPAGERKILLLQTGAEATNNMLQSEPAWTDAELDAMLVAKPKTGAEIAESDAVGGWDHLGITDSVAYVDEIRRKRKVRQWQRD